MIHDKDLPMFIWAEACNMVVYVKKLSPQRILGDNNPEENYQG
jgi:hypothetical protein